ncbi:MAG: zinc ribbon domain-containing protein [Calditrichaeota bacterium]|nr:zinc ribbon domain-containing protein [Calditrichota bacterium]MBT7617728.1 zinc ribbon domain-containing protein [Calditrichota bacterium]MBT7787703.1 zinc ribbon domain-containing protein [Calditrichota bacterium]
MPIYEFVCAGCSEKFEKLTSFDWRSSGIECPNCKSKELERFVSLIGGFATKNSNNGSETSKMSMAKSNAACSHCSGKSCSTC